MDVHNWESGYFIQDDFRINSKVTLNMGLRYDVITPFIDANDLMANLDPNFVSSTGHIGRFVVPSSATFKYLDPAIVNFGVVTADQSGLGIGRGLLQTDHTAFGPRVGLAWQVMPRTVVRGGYGLYYPTSAAQGIRDPLATNTFNQGRTKKGTGAWPSGASGGSTTPFTGGAVQGFGNTPSANYVPFNLKNPRVQQWNATVEREIPWQSSLRFSYIGGKETGEIVGRDLNFIAPSNNGFGTTAGDGVTPCDPAGLSSGLGCDYSPADLARLKIPSLGDFVTGFANLGHSLTTSFQVEAKRQARGLQFSVAYTFLDQKSSGLDVGNSSLGGNAYNQTPAG